MQKQIRVSASIAMLLLFLVSVAMRTVVVDGVRGGVPESETDVEWVSADFRIVNTGIVGDEPAIHGDEIAFFTLESMLDEDLDGDGAKLWAVIRYYNTSSHQLKNTQVDGTYPAIYTDILAFSSFGVRYYNVSEEALVNLGFENLGVSDPSVYENIFAFTVYEDGYTGDLNGDGHLDDSVVLFFDLAEHELVNIHLEGWGTTVYGGIIAFSTFESSVGEDLNEDEDLDDSVIRYYNITSETVVNTGAEGWWPCLSGNIIAFESSHPTYSALTYYNVTDGSVVDTKIDGRMPSVYNDIVVFTSPESSYGVGDLNGDGDDSDCVIGYYNISSSEWVNTCAEGNSPSIYSTTVTFSSRETYSNEDLNGDGDTDDDVIRYLYLEPIPTVENMSIGFYGNSYGIYEDSLGQYLTEQDWSVSAVDQDNFTTVDIVYMDFRDSLPIATSMLLNYVENGGSLWIGGEAVGGTFLGVNVSSSSIWFDGSLNNARVRFCADDPLLASVQSITYPAGASIEVSGNIREVIRIDNKTVLAVDDSRGGKIVWLVDSDMFGNFWLNQTDNKLLAKRIVTWLSDTFLLGDVNGDDFVDLLDALQAASAFGTQPGQMKWTDSCDINLDCIIDVFDLVLLASHFGLGRI